jgi:hypothetical protein
VNPQVREKLKSYPVRNYLAWLLYAHSPKGEGIENPVAFAVSRVLQQEIPDDEYMQLASYPPEELIRQLDLLSTPRGRYASWQLDDTLRKVFLGTKEYDALRIQELLDILR